MAIDQVRRAPARSTPPRGTGRRAVIVLAAVAAVIAAVVLVARAESGATISADPTALARVDLGALAGSVDSVHATGPDGRSIPLTLRDGRMTPREGAVAPGERVSVEVVVRRPAGLSWLLGGARTRETLELTAPAARLTGPRVVLQPGASLRLRFDQPVVELAYGTGGSLTPQRLAAPAASTTVPVRGAAGTLAVAAAPRAWERLGAPEPLAWFPASSLPAAVASPGSATPVAPTTPLRLTFSKPVAEVLGAAQPAIAPATPGSWRRTDDYTLTFTPSGAGAALGSQLSVALPRDIALVGANGTLRTTRTVGWRVLAGSPTRLQQLLAEQGYLPLAWNATGPAVASDLVAQTTAAVQPPAGSFTWRYPNVPAELRALWRAGQPNDITRGAVMVFQNSHGLTVDGVAGPRLWRALIADAIAGRHSSANGYSYVYVHRDASPQSLTLWHNGRTVLTSPGNTGVAAAPTALGTYPVFEHLPVTTMSGNNPDGSHYSDPGIKWVSYFNGGDAVHAFDRASFGTPQSVGCVELPADAAAQVWPYMPIGTLVTIEP